MLQITSEIVKAAHMAAQEMNREMECVHVHEDGHCTIGTDGKTTTPVDWGDVVYTYDPNRTVDPWDCFVPVPCGCGPHAADDPADLCDRCKAVMAYEAELAEEEDDEDDRPPQCEKCCRDLEPHGPIHTGTSMTGEANYIWGKCPECGEEVEVYEQGGNGWPFWPDPA